MTSPVFRALDYHFIVRADAPDVEALAELFQGLSAGDAASDKSPDDLEELTFSPDGPARSARNASAVGIMNRVNEGAQRSSRGQLMLHGAALASATGDCLVLSGASGSGKSTLTASLLQPHRSGRTFAYLTDETVSFRPQDLRITPFRKPLQLKRPSHSLLPQLGPEPGSRLESLMWFQWLVPPHRLGGASIPTAPLFPRMLVLPLWSEGMATSLTRLPPGEAAALTSENAAFFTDVDGGGLSAVARLARRVSVFRLTFGDHAEAREAIMERWRNVT